VIQHEFTGYTASTQNQLTGITANTEAIVEERVQWLNLWTGGTYQKNDMVRDGDWTMVANKETYDTAAPQEDGDPTYVLPDLPPFTAHTNSSVVWSSNEYEFLEGGWIKSIRVYVPELSSNTHYSFIVADTTNPDSPQFTRIHEGVLIEK